MNEYLRDLNDRLRRRGVPRRVRRRILAEAGDHLQSDEQSISRFGDAALIAQRFADEMGWRAARRSAIDAFWALATAGLLVAVLGLTWSATGSLRHVAHELVSPLPVVVAAVLAVAPQVSLAAGLLAVLRVWRRRGSAALPAAEVCVIRRRTAVALLAGLATLAAMALYSVVFAEYLPAWSRGLAIWGAIGAGPGLAGVAVRVLRASRYQIAVDGDPGDVFVDIGTRFVDPLGASPWVFAALISSAAGLVVFAAGVLASDGVDGALRGLAEGAACFIGFAVCSRYLGMRVPTSAAPAVR